MDKSSYHVPVMLEESIGLLQIDPNGTYVDCTLGEGGHSFEIFSKLSKDGVLYSFDHDPQAIEYVRSKYVDDINTGRWKLINENFSSISKHFEKESINGILMDLGISSRQLDASDKGISYSNEDAPLDMRMDPNLGVTAADLLQVLDEKQLMKLFFEYGEERHSKRIARSIKKSDKPITTVGELNHVIDRAMPAASSNKHPSQKIFQALRIAVNDELGSLQSGLSDSIDLLSPNGRIVVISFHSLEDRIVKHRFRDDKADGKLTILTKKPIQPTANEITLNSRASSAKLRAAEKI